MKNRNRFRKTYLFKVLLIIGTIIILSLVTIPLSFNDHSYMVTVTDKDRINKDSGSYYLVYCDDIATKKSLVFKNIDNTLRFKWNSSNVQGQLKPNHNYKLTVIGYRMPYMSMYENILDVEEVK